MCIDRKIEKERERGRGGSEWGGGVEVVIILL